MRSYDCTIPSPLGPLRVQFSDRGLVSISIRSGVECSQWSGPYSETDDDRLAALKTFITDYFYGRDPGIDDIPLDMSGMTGFRKRVYDMLSNVPYGSLITYGELAERVGCPGGFRAVGNALNRNPFLLVVPCHRVVRAASPNRYEVGGFGSGIDVKRFLLRSEGHDELEVIGL